MSADLELLCTVCGDEQDYNDDRFIFCDGCNVGLHQSCYGLQDEVIDEGADTEFKCHHCKQGDVSNTKIIDYKACILCRRAKGGLAITTIDNELGKWCHVICAYAFKCKSRVTDNSKPPCNIIIDTHSLQPYKEENGKRCECVICKATSGHKLKCLHPDCATKIHPSCARRQWNSEQNKNACSFFFDDLYQDLVFRDAVFICSEHSNLCLESNKKRKQNRDQQKRVMLQLIETWKQQSNQSESMSAKNQHKNGKEAKRTRKRKRGSNGAQSTPKTEPKSKRRKLNAEDELSESDGSDKLEICDVCGKGFKSVSAMHGHKSMHSKQKRKSRHVADDEEEDGNIISCDDDAQSAKQCVRQHGIQTLAEQDKTAKHGRDQEHNIDSAPTEARVDDIDKSASCDICGKTFKSALSVRIHKRVHKRQAMMTLKNAEEEDDDDRGSAIDGDEDNESDSATANNKCICAVCGKLFGNAGALGAHKQVHIKDQNAICNLCGDTFRTHKGLKMHVSKKHRSPKPPTPATKKMKIETEAPSSSDESWNELVAALQSMDEKDDAANDQSVTCDICGKITKSQRGLSIHKRVHRKKPESIQSEQTEHGNNTQMEPTTATQQTMDEFTMDLDLESSDSEDLHLLTSDDSDSDSEEKHDNDIIPDSPSMDTASMGLYHPNATRSKSKPLSLPDSKIANVHDFRYSMDQCYCYKCLDIPALPIKDEDKEENESEEMKMKEFVHEKEKQMWFNHDLYFARKFTFYEINVDQKRKYTAPFCENVEIKMDHSATWPAQEDAAADATTEALNLNGYESTALYNHTAINEAMPESPEVPQTPFQTVPNDIMEMKANFNKKRKKRPAKTPTEENPLNKYYNRNPFNFLCVFADIYDKYHSVSAMDHVQNHQSSDKPPSPQMDKHHIIQIWKIKKNFKKKLKQKTRSNKRGWMKAPRQHKNAVFYYGVQHKGGFIWDMKWLPFRVIHKTDDDVSNENDHKTTPKAPYQRMGVLAVCSEDGFVHIYSLPFVAKNSLMIKIEPVIKLSVTNHRFLRLAWSSNTIHPMLIASSTNGCVATWDLDAITDKIEKMEQDEKAKFDGHLMDQHSNLVSCHSANETITALSWCSDHLKYFTTISQNGCMRLWDVNNLYTPIFTRKLHSFTTDMKWIPGMDATLITVESGATNSNVLQDTGDPQILNQPSNFLHRSDICTKFASIWPQQYMQNCDAQRVDPDSLSLPTLNQAETRNYPRMGTVVQFPAERLFGVADKVALSVDVLLKCECRIHENDRIDLTKAEDINDADKLISNEEVVLYVVVGYDSGNVIFYQYKLKELANNSQRANGQILSQLVYAQNDGENGNKNECSLIGPFYGVDSNVDRNEYNVARYTWTAKDQTKPVYDPYHVHPTKLALDDNVAIRRVAICPNGEYLDVVSASISGLIRIQTVRH